MKNSNDRNLTNDKESKKYGMGENLQREWENEPNAEALLDAKELLKIDPKMALKRFESLAKNGSSLSMFYLGGIHNFGRYGVNQDYKISKHWRTQAACSGSIEAAWSLGRRYELENDYALAESWYRQASEFGHSPSLFALGLAHYQGDWFDRDIPKAIDYLGRAETLGHFLASQWLWQIFLKEDLGAVLKIRGWVKRIIVTIPYTLYRVNYPNSDRLRR